MPASHAIQGDSIGLCRRNGAGPAEPHPANLWDQHLAGPPVQTPDMPGPDGNNPEPLIPSSLTPGGLAVRPVKEARHCLGVVAERLLLHHLASSAQPSMFCSRLGQLTALLQVPRRARAPGPPPGLLLHGKIPDVPSVGAIFPQCRRLGRRRRQAVPGHTKTLASTTDIQER